MRATDRRWRLALAVAGIAALAAQVLAQNFEVDTHTLKNGMKILVQEDHTIPSVAMYIFYRIGSRNERPGTTGISHFLEHMMSNGAKKYGPDEFDRVIEAAGGSEDAYTNKDVTVYQDWFPRTALELIFDLEADRIRYLAFDPNMIASERGVVASERRLRVDSSNFGILNEQLWSAAFTAHPYQWPTVGWMVDIENWTTDDLKHHFAMGYSPSNATMVVVGDVTSDQIVSLAKKYLEPIASRAPPPKVTTVEPEQQGERRVVVKKFAQLPLLMVGYHIPQSTSPDFYALHILELVLLSGQTSRMHRRIVDKDQLAISVGGGFVMSLDPTLFTIVAQPQAGVDPQAVESVIYEELNRVKNEPISNDEFQKARNILLAGFYREMKTINGRANTLGTYEVFLGDYHKLFTAVDEYNKITKADVQRVAQKYFSDKNRTVATLVPEESKAPKP